MNFIPLQSIAFDRVQIMSWQSFLPRKIHKKTSQQDLNSLSSNMSISFYYDPCQATASNLAFYINPQRRPDIV
jgi:transposase